MPFARATAALVALGVMIGCGGEEPTAVVRGQTVEITLDDFLIAPQNVAAKPGRMTFRVVNRGRLRHSFRIWGANRAPVEIESILPGDETVRVGELAPGEYRLVCTVSNHAELGMTGRLVVR